VKKILLALIMIGFTSAYPSENTMPKGVFIERYSIGCFKAAKKISENIKELYQLELICSCMEKEFIKILPEDVDLNKITEIMESIKKTCFK